MAHGELAERVLAESGSCHPRIQEVPGAISQATLPIFRRCALTVIMPAKGPTIKHGWCGLVVGGLGRSLLYYFPTSCTALHTVLT